MLEEGKSFDFIIYLCFFYATLKIKLCDAIRCCFKSDHYRLCNTRGKKEVGKHSGDLWRFFCFLKFYDSYSFT